MVLLVASISLAKPIKFGLERLKSTNITFIDIQQKLSCYPTLISHWNQEKGFVSEVKVESGDISLVRTDIGDPDGNLFVSIKGESVCEIELSLMPDIYYNSKDRLLLIYGYSGSNHFIELFNIVDECKYLGWASLDSKSDLEEVKINWYHQPDGDKICNR